MALSYPNPTPRLAGAGSQIHPAIVLEGRSGNRLQPGELPFHIQKVRRVVEDDPDPPWGRGM